MEVDLHICGFAGLYAQCYFFIASVLQVLQQETEQTGKPGEFVLHNGTCNEERAMELAQYAREKQYDVIVGVGLLLQNFFNGETEENTALIALMKRYGMPYCVTDIGVVRKEEVLEEYYRRLCGTSTVDDTNQEECERLRKGLRYLWGIQ